MAALCLIGNLETMGVVIAVIAIFGAIGAFFCLSHLNKAIFIGYLCFFFHEFSNRDFDDTFYILKLLMGGAALFVFLVSISLAETKQGKKEVALFFLKYGGLYVLMVTLIKLVLFAFAGFDTRAWEGIDVFVTMLPYKWVLFILFLAAISSFKNN